MVVASIILTNLIPVFGVLYLDWGIETLVSLYWLEAGVIGIFNVFKMISAMLYVASLPPHRRLHWPISRDINTIVGLFILPYGLLWLFPHLALSAAFPDAVSGWWPVIGIFTRHLVSFKIDFIDLKKYKTVPETLVFAPYGRVAVVGLTLLFAPISILVSGNFQSVLVVMVVVKTLFEIFIEIQSRKPRQKFLVEYFLEDDQESSNVN